MFSSALGSLSVCLSVCLSVSRITQRKLCNRFSQNSMERWHMGYEKKIRFLWQSGSRYVMVKVGLWLQLRRERKIFCDTGFVGGDQVISATLGFVSGDRVIPHNTGYSIPGDCLTVAISRDQQPCGGMHYTECHSSF